MAGGIDWFRWHHGSVADPKFQLVARKAKTNVAAVIAVWAFLLEKASAAEFRGCFGDLDCEAIDCLFGLDDGTTVAILGEMVERKLIADEYIVAWDKRQVKRERQDATNADRQRAFRAKQNEVTPSNANDENVTPSNATSHQKTPREEESREEKKEIPRANAVIPPGFAKFWDTWPTNDRKQAKGKCLDAWKKASAERDAALVLAHVEALKNGAWLRDGGQFVCAPLVYLNQRRWEGVDLENQAQGGLLAGAI